MGFRVEENNGGWTNREQWELKQRRTMGAAAAENIWDRSNREHWEFRIDGKQCESEQRNQKGIKSTANNGMRI